MHALTEPLLLDANQPRDRFYDGGAFISEFRGIAGSVAHTPEDWIGSTTEVRGEGPAGLTLLPDGVPLRESVAADPVGWLGAKHVARWGASPEVLVKLLDAGERLPVHLHPDAPFAARNLGCSHGKAEAWFVLRGGEVFVGLRSAVTRQTLKDLVDRQDRAKLLGMLNRIRVEPGDSVLVPPGTLHAIGEGIAVVEVQQPEDLSILLEWRDYGIADADAASLDLGFDVALDAATLTALGPESLAQLVRRHNGRGSCLPERASTWFRLEKVGGGDILEPGFGVVIGLENQLAISWGGDSAPVRAGETMLLSASLGRCEFSGSGVALVAGPPRA